MDRSKTKVAILLHGLGPNGIDTLFANLAEEWDLNKYDVTYLLAVDKGNMQFWEDRVLSAGIKIVHLTDLDGKKLFFWPIVLAKALRKYGPFDVIHVNMDMLNGINLCVAKWAGIPKRLCHSHVTSNRKSGSRIKQTLKNVYLFIMKKLMVGMSTDRIACSEMAGDYFFGKDNYSVVNNGIQIARFMTGKHNNDMHHLNMVTVGRMTTPKNPFFLLEIINEVYSQVPDMDFYWIGNGEFEDELKKKATDLECHEHIHFLGVRNDVQNLLQECDFFLLPSLYEGLGVVLIEAQAAGLTCFTSDTVPKLADCGACCFLPLDIGARKWADEIVSFYKNGKRLEAIPEKLQEFDIRYMARTLEKLYIS